MVWFKNFIPTFAVLGAFGVLALSPAPAWGVGGIADGGGGAEVVPSKPFSDPKRLEKALQVLESRVRSSRYPDGFLQALVTEARDLQKAGRYRQVPELVFARGTKAAEMLRELGYELPEDIGDTLSLAAVTRLKRGSNVVFSTRGASAGVEELAELIAHEVSHHILLPGAASNEPFVDELAKSIVRSEYKSSLALGIRYGLVVRPGYVSGMGVARMVLQLVLQAAPQPTPVLMESFHDLDSARQPLSAETLALAQANPLEYVMGKLAKRIPGNVADLSVSEFADDYIHQIIFVVFRHGEVLWQSYPDTYEVTYKREPARDALLAVTQLYRPFEPDFRGRKNLSLEDRATSDAFFCERAEWEPMTSWGIWKTQRLRCVEPSKMKDWFNARLIDESDR